MRSKRWLTRLFSVVILIGWASCASAEQAREECCICGMWIDRYMHTRHVLTLSDGVKVSFCSSTCAVKHLKEQGGEAKRLQAADWLTAELIEAEDAFYLVGSDAPPVMSYISVIAFAGREAAEDYREEHGGEIMNFDEMMGAK